MEQHSEQPQDLYPAPAPEIQETPQEITCKHCHKTVPAAQKFCTHCGFPINATPEEEDQFYYRQGAKQMELSSLDHTISNAKKALWIIAALMGVVGLGMYFLNEGDPGASAMLITNLIVSGIFVALGFWANEKPFTALLSALILFITIYLYGVIVEGQNPVSGIIVRVIVVVYLIKGINSAKEAEQLKKELNH